MQLFRKIFNSLRKQTQVKGIQRATIKSFGKLRFARIQNLGDLGEKVRDCSRWYKKPFLTQKPLGNHEPRIALAKRYRNISPDWRMDSFPLLTNFQSVFTLPDSQKCHRLGGSLELRATGRVPPPQLSSWAIGQFRQNNVSLLQLVESFSLLFSCAN